MDALSPKPVAAGVVDMFTIGVDDVAVGAVAVKNVAVFMLTRAPSLFRFFSRKS